MVEGFHFFLPHRDENAQKIQRSPMNCNVRNCQPSPGNPTISPDTKDTLVHDSQLHFIRSIR
jgi:hypothetical protein